MTPGPWKVAVWNKNRRLMRYCLRRTNPAWPFGWEPMAINGGPWLFDTRQNAEWQLARINGAMANGR